MIKKAAFLFEREGKKPSYRQRARLLGRLLLYFLFAPVRFAARRLESALQPARTPIVPPQSVAGTSLAAVIAIMSFLACLTLAAVTMVFEQASLWENDVSSELTIQILPQDGVDIESQIMRALALAGQAPGVGEARPLSAEESAALLEPWLGGGLDLVELPVPRLIVLEVLDPALLDVKALRAALDADMPGVVLDDHGIWINQLKQIANVTIGTGIGIFLLMLAATSLSVVFATRGAMAGNQAVVSVLHFIGAEGRFIAQEFQRRFLLIGLKGGVLGTGSAILFFVLSGNLLSFLRAPSGGNPFETLFGGFSLSPLVFAGFGFVLAVVASLTALTTRLTVERYLAAVE